MTALPDDPSDRPTRMTEIAADGTQQQQVLEHEPDATPDPWYRSRVLLALWALMVALLITLIIYGLVELSRGGGSSIPTPHSSTTPTRSSTTSPTTPSTTTETPPPPETPEQTPAETPPPVNNSPSPAASPRHHHHFHLPHLF